MPALPTPGSNLNTWGTELNEFLQVSLLPDGTVKGDVWDDGDHPSFYAPWVTPAKLAVSHGSAAVPQVDSAPVLKVARVGAVPRTNIEGKGGVGTDGSDQMAAVMGVSESLTGEQVQGVGVAGFAKTHSTSAGSATSGNDAAGLYGAGRALADSINAVGIGTFTQGRRDTAASALTGIEVSSWNAVASAGTLSTTGPSTTKGIWATAGGLADSGPAFQIGNPWGRQFSDGIHFNGQVTGGKTGGVRDTSIRDDSQSATGILIKGTHAAAALAVGAGAGDVLVGGESSLDASAIFEVQGANVFADPLVFVGSVANNKGYSVRLRNSSGQGRWSIASGANEFATGSVAGDTLLQATSAGKALHLGGLTGRVMSVSQDNKVSWFGAAPVAQQSLAAAATDAATTQALANSIRGALIAYGLGA